MISNQIAIRRLMGFYEYNRRLLYAKREFLGYDPLFSVPLDAPEVDAPGEIETEHNFVIRNETFRISISKGTFLGPLRGYTKKAVWRNEQRIIFQETRGGAYTGTYYREGTDYFIEGNRAYLIVDGFQLKYLEDVDTTYRELDFKKYYLLIFNAIAVPLAFTPLRIDPPEKKEDYFREDLEQLRQLWWASELQVPAGMLRVEKSGVSGFGWTGGKEGRTIYKECSKWTALEKEEIIVAGNKYVFESRW